jgi:hypothetical protein
VKGSTRRYSNIGKSRQARVLAFLGLFACVLGAFVTLDALNQAPASSSVRPSHAVLPPRGRVLVLLIDSLRYETANDATVMPNLAALRAESAFARVTPTRDAVTIPCVRAAFTGEDGTRLLAFVTNFVKRNAGVVSLFTELGAQGRKAATFSDGAFIQFGTVGRDEFPNGHDWPDEVRDENTVAEHAVELFHSGDYDLCIMHVTYTDHISHKAGVGTAPYKERFSAADRLAARLSHAVGSDDTFVVMGDHGHDLKGRHAFGLDVPTFALYRGPRFRQGLDLGTIAIRDHRYLMGWAIGLPLSPAYGGGRHPNALASPDPLPEDYAATSIVDDSADATTPRRAPLSYLALIAVLCAAVAAWVGVFLPRPNGASPHHPMFAALPMFLGAAAFAAFGGAFPGIRPWFHEPAFKTIAAAWAGLWLMAFAVARYGRDPARGWPLLVLPLFVLVPTVYRYGAAPAMGPAWMGFVMCTVLATANVSLAAGAREWLSSLVTSRVFAVVVFTLAMLYPFSGAEAFDYRFETWVFYPVAIGKGARIWFALAFVAKLVLFFRPRLPARSMLAATAALLLLTSAEAVWVPAKVELLVAVGLLLTAWTRRRRLSGTPADAGDPLVRIAAIAGTLLLFRAVTELDGENYRWLECFLAAVVGSARLVALAVPPSARRLAYSLLLFFAWVGTAWTSFAFTVHRLEWTFLYDWFAASFVEQHVWIFVPVILFRYLLPLILARFLIAEELGRPDPEALNGCWTLVGAKVLIVLLFACGVGWKNSQSDVYLEAAQEAGIGTVFTAGLL